MGVTNGWCVVHNGQVVVWHAIIQGRFLLEVDFFHIRYVVEQYVDEGVPVTSRLLVEKSDCVSDLMNHNTRLKASSLLTVSSWCRTCMSIAYVYPLPKENRIYSAICMYFLEFESWRCSNQIVTSSTFSASVMTWPRPRPSNPWELGPDRLIYAGIMKSSSPFDDVIEVQYSVCGRHLYI